MQEYDDEWAENEDLAYTWGITEGFKQRFDAGFQVRGRIARGEVYLGGWGPLGPSSEEVKGGCTPGRGIPPIRGGGEGGVYPWEGHTPSAHHQRRR